MRLRHLMPGNTVKLTASATPGDYCVFASNLDATTATGKAFLVYPTAVGGFQPARLAQPSAPSDSQFQQMKHCQVPARPAA